MKTLVKQFPASFSGVLLLGMIWLFSGFALGTVMLLGPLRLCMNYARSRQFSSRAENAIVILLILLLVLISFGASIKLFHWRLGKGRWHHVIAIGTPFLAAVLAFWSWMHPSTDNDKKSSEVIAAQFTIGPYPTEEKMQELKNEGYTAIISLLHNAVIPFEPELLKKEKAAAQKLHIQFIHAPMLPWLGDNDHSIKAIEHLVKQGQGKYYIHCYLGKDRVNLVKKLILQLKSNALVKAPPSERTFETQGAFERGVIYQIDTQVYLTPFPTDEEILAFFMAGNVKSVVNIMDTTVVDTRPWIEKEKKALMPMNIHYQIIPVREQATDKDMAPVLQAIDHLPKPLVVHHWNTHSPASALLRKNYYAHSTFTAINLSTKEKLAY